MDILEKELEDLIWDKIQSGDFDGLSNKGLSVCHHSKFWRQYNFSSYGIADIVSLYIVKSERNWNFYIDLYELKKEAVNMDTLIQAARYVKAMQRMADDWNYRYSKGRKIKLYVNIHLVGKKISEGGFLYLPDIFNNLFLYEYKFDFDSGLCFEQKVDYHLIEENKFITPSLHGAI